MRRSVEARATGTTACRTTRGFASATLSPEYPPQPAAPCSPEALCTSTINHDYAKLRPMTSQAPPRPFESGSSKGIRISDWTITSTKLPILNAPESDACALPPRAPGRSLIAFVSPNPARASARLHLPLPEICFGNNKLVIEDAKSGLRLEWGAIAALTDVKTETGVKVAHAEEWARG
jgi:hypothetical protein